MGQKNQDSGKFFSDASYKTLNEIFARDYTYVIPEYQRPYSWDCLGKSDKNNQVNIMWEDIYSYYRSKNQNPYFLGSIVVISKTETTFEVIDGQQRLTTFAILLNSIICFLKGIQSSEAYDKKDENVKTSLDTMISIITELIVNKKTIGALYTKDIILKIEKNSDFDYGEIFQKSMEHNLLFDDKEIENLLKYAPEEQKDTAFRYFNNRDYFIGQIKAEFSAKIFSYKNIQELNSFVEFLKQKVGMIRIISNAFETAYQMFEILNNRGLPLSNKDLFRNFLIRSFSKDNDRNKKWNDLETKYEFSNDFISRWVESKNAQKQKYSAFNDLQEIYKTLYKSKIQDFYSDFKKDLHNYTSLYYLNTQSGNIDKEIKNRALFLINAEPIHSVNLLLSLFRLFPYFNEKIKREELVKIQEFLKTVELYTLATLLIPQMRFESGRIFQSIKELNSKKIDMAGEKLKLSQQERNQLKNGFDTAIKDNQTAKLIILKYAWILDSDSGEDVIDVLYNTEEMTLEHIIPQNPETGTNWVKDFSASFRTEYTYKLGNMTLLTRKRNSSAKNLGYQKKIKIYEKTKLTITSELLDVKMNENFIKNRHSKILKKIYEDLKL